jgi:hypothetical protein
MYGHMPALFAHVEILSGELSNDFHLRQEWSSIQKLDLFVAYGDRGDLERKLQYFADQLREEKLPSLRSLTIYGCPGTWPTQIDLEVIDLGPELLYVGLTELCGERNVTLDVFDFDPRPQECWDTQYLTKPRLIR